MREHLSKRDKWQDKANLGGLSREETAKKILATYLLSEPIYTVIEKPQHLRHIYDNKWGICPDFSIENTLTGKIAFFETKRQGTQGNAHERACKYFAPGIERICTAIAGFDRPFFFIFMNGLTQDPKKRAEITAWFDAPGYEDRVLLWENRDIHKLIAWFEGVIRRCLE